MLRNEAAGEQDNSVLADLLKVAEQFTRQRGGVLPGGQPPPMDGVMAILAATRLVTDSDAADGSASLLASWSTPATLGSVLLRGVAEALVATAGKESGRFAAITGAARRDYGLLIRLVPVSPDDSRDAHGLRRDDGEEALRSHLAGLLRAAQDDGDVQQAFATACIAAGHKILEPRDTRLGLHGGVQREASEVALGRDRLALALAHLIRTARDEFSLAVFGRWGSGKTVLAGEVEKLLVRKDGIKRYQEAMGSLTRAPLHRLVEYHVVRFSAWQYRKPPESWVYLLEAFLEAVRQMPWWRHLSISLRRNVLTHGAWIGLFIPLVVTAALLNMTALVVILLPLAVSILGLWSLISLPLALRTGRAKLAPALTRLLRLPDHSERLGLQAVIGKDLRLLLRAWVPVRGASRFAWLPIALGILALVATFLAWFWVLRGGGVAGAMVIPLADRGCELVARFVPLGIEECRSSFAVASSWTAHAMLYAWAALALACVLPLLPLILVKEPGRRLLLIVDDLDRCEPGDMLGQIEALKLLLEDEEVKTRVQLVVLADEDVLRSATRAKFAALTRRRNGRDAEQVVTEHFEKLFLCHIRLQEIDQDGALQLVHLVMNQLNGKPVERKAPEDLGLAAPLDAKPSAPTQPGATASQAAPDPGKRPKRRGSDKPRPAFTEDDERALREALEAGPAPQPPLTPRALRSFVLKYMLARTLLQVEGRSVSAAELAEVLAEETVRHPGSGTAHPVGQEQPWTTRWVARHVA